jgi:hypothetical protein
MARRCGRSPRGERCRASVPHGHWQTPTFTAGLRLNGLTAPLVLDGPMDGQCFLAYVEQLLAPSLHRGDIVILDNLLTTMRSFLLKLGVAIFFVNFAAFLLGVAVVGGDAANGYAEGGRYFLSFKGEITEVTRAVCVYSYVHLLSLLPTAALSIFAAISCPGGRPPYQPSAFGAATIPS